MKKEISPVKKRSSKWGNEGKYLYLFAGPAMVFMLVLSIYPIVYNFFLMFRNMSSSTFFTHKFVGLDTINQVFAKGVIWQALWNTVLFTVACTVMQLVLGLALALLLNKALRVARFARSMIVISYIIPLTVTGLLFKFIFQADTGILNYLLRQVGLISESITWLTSPSLALWTIIVANIWVGVPFDMMLLTTGLSNISEEVYESASIDGAGKLQRFFRITMPLLKPAIYSILILGVIYTVKMFDLVKIMTAGGPVNATELLSTYSYRLGFNEMNFSQASVVANFMFLLLVVVAIFYLQFVREDEVIS